MTEPTTAGPEMRFDNAAAFYGSLRPGARNHWVVRTIPGTWVDAVIRGYVFDITWGDYEGHVGFVSDPDGHRVPVSVLVSPALPSHVGEVDDFEGPGYERRPLTVFDADGETAIGEAGVYEFLTDRE